MIITNAEVIIRKTAEQVDGCYRCAKVYCKSASSIQTFHDQAFGMISLATVLIPTDYLDKLSDLWDEYKPKFEALIYGE